MTSLAVTFRNAKRRNALAAFDSCCTTCTAISSLREENVRRPAELMCRGEGNAAIVHAAEARRKIAERGYLFQSGCAASQRYGVPASQKVVPRNVDGDAGLNPAWPSACVMLLVVPPIRANSAPPPMAMLYRLPS